MMYLNAVEAHLKREARQEAEKGMRSQKRSASCETISRNNHSRQSASSTEKSNFVARVKVIYSSVDT